jgi:IS30 family transposase
MTNYKQLGQQQRYVIDRLLEKGASQTAIAQAIGCHKSTISRELRRNGYRRIKSGKMYNPVSAQRKTWLRHYQKPKCQRFTQAMKQRVARLLRTEKLSPELVSVLGRQQDPGFVSHEAIYQWIWEMKFSHCRQDRPFHGLYRELRHGRRRRKRGNYRDNRGLILNRTSIEERPKIVEKRSRLGDVELDLMLGLNHQVGLLVIVDRASLWTWLSKIRSKESDYIERAIVRKLQPCSSWIKTLTYDNDRAFLRHESVNKTLNTKSYFTHPYTSQEKGTVENRIGLLRRFFPKRTDFSKISSNTVRKVERMINDRPVRKFNYLTPNEVLLQKAPVALIT